MIVVYRLKAIFKPFYSKFNSSLPLLSYYYFIFSILYLLAKFNYYFIYSILFLLINLNSYFLLCFHEGLLLFWKLRFFKGLGSTFIRVYALSPKATFRLSSTRFVISEVSRILRELCTMIQALIAIPFPILRVLSSLEPVTPSVSFIISLIFRLVSSSREASISSSAAL
jgi:hypothetical protein